jgi:FtsH-binding integral membrane protein
MKHTFSCYLARLILAIFAMVVGAMLAFAIYAVYTHIDLSYAGLLNFLKGLGIFLFVCALAATVIWSADKVGNC